MTELVVDTNVFLRFLLGDVPSQYKEAKRLFTLAKKGQYKLHVPQIVIFEVFFALEKYYHFSRPRVLDKLKGILGAQYLIIQDRDIFNEAIKLAYKHNLSIADCFLVSFAKFQSSQLFSFDKDVVKLSSNK